MATIDPKSFYKSRVKTVSTERCTVAVRPIPSESEDSEVDLENDDGHVDKSSSDTPDDSLHGEDYVTDDSLHGEDYVTDD